MKFPVVFRVYAVLNIIAFLLFGITSVALTAKASKFGLSMAWVHWSITIWLFVSSVAWFFASRYSYHFLYSVASLLLMTAGYWIWMIWISPEAPFSMGDKMVLTGVPALITFYAVFLIAALFYKPVVAWTETRINYRHMAVTGSVVLFIGLSLFTMGKLNRQTYYVLARATHGYFEPLKEPDIISQGDPIRFDFYEQSAVNGFIIKTPEGDLSEVPETAKIVFTDRNKLDTLTAKSMVIEFKKNKNRWVAEFPPISVRRLIITFHSTSEVSAAEFSIDEIDAVWFYDWFDNDVNGKNYLAVALEAELLDEGNGKTVNKQTYPDLCWIFLRGTGFSDESPYRFDYSSGAITLTESDEATKRIGMYRLGISQLKSYAQEAARKFQEFSEYDYERYLSELMGMNLYASKAKTESKAGNGTNFNHINPEVIDWVESNLVPKSNTVILRHTAQEYYDVTFKNFARAMVRSYQELTQQGLQGEADSYIQESHSPEFYGPDFLYSKYKGTISEDGEEESSYSEMCGFWLRRKIDNTDQKCWTLLGKIMNEYDSEWFKQAQAKIQTPQSSEVKAADSVKFMTNIQKK